MSRARWLLAVLVVLNIGYFAWTRGALAMFGTAPASLSEREPQRVVQQIRPEVLQIRKASDPVPEPAAPASAPEAPAPAAPAPSTAPNAGHEGL